MLPRARLLAGLRGGGPDRIPWAPYIGADHFRALFPEEWQQAEDRKNTDQFAALRLAMSYHASVGADYVSSGAPFAYKQRQPNVTVRRRSRGASTYVEYETPIGTLYSEEGTSPGVSHAYTKKHPVESAEDMRVYTYMVEDTEVTENYAFCQAWLDAVGESGVGLASCPDAPVKELILRPMSVEGLIFAIHDHCQAFDRLVEAMHRLHLQIYRICAASPAAVFMPQGVSGTHIMSPGLYREWCVPYSRAYADILHEKQKLYLSLTAGERLKGIVSEIEQCGFDGIWAYQPTREGNASIAELRRAWGNRLCTAGGMFSDCLCRGSRQEVSDMARWVLNQVQPHDRFILSSSSIVVPGTPTENLAAVGEVVVDESGRHIR